MWCRALGALALVFAASTSPAVAVPLNYAESISGDLSGPLVLGSPLTILAFDIGLNTVSGRFRLVDNNVTALNDFDSFAFTIPTGAALVTGGVSVTDSEGDIVDTM